MDKEYIVKSGLLEYIPGDTFIVKRKAGLMDLDKKIKIKDIEDESEVFILAPYNKLSSIVLHNGDRGYMSNILLKKKPKDKVDISELIDDDRAPKEPRTASAGRG